MNNPQKFEMGHQVILTGKIMGRTYTAPMSYDVLLDSGQLIRGIPADNIKLGGGSYAGKESNTVPDNQSKGETVSTGH